MNPLRWMALAVMMALAAALPARAQPVIADHVTPGGLAFRYAEMPEAQSQIIEFGWKDSFAMVRAGKQGLISLGPALILQGPAGMTRGEFIEDAKDLQARWHLGGSTHFLTGGVSAPPETFEAAVALFARTLAEPALRADHLAELKKRTRANIRQGASGAGHMANQIASQLAVPEGNLKVWALGAPEMFEAIDLADIQAWRQAVLAREGVLVAAAGPLPAAEAGKAIDQLFAGLPARGTPTPSPAFELLEPKSRVVLREADVPQTLLQVSGWTGYRNDGELVRGRIAMRILQKRLFDTIRGKLGAAYGANAGISSFLPERYSITLSSSVAHDRAAEALAAMQEVYRLFLAEGVNEAEVAPLKLRMISEAGEAFGRAPSLASAVLSAMLNDLPADHVASSIRRIEAVSAEAINADLRAKLAGRPITAIVVAPASAPFKADCVVKAAAEVLAACR